MKKMQSAAEFKYSTQNPEHRRGGCESKKQEGIICATDNGEGFPGGQADAPDFIGIKFEKGVYKNYKNCGPVQGNVQADVCYDNL